MNCKVCGNAVSDVDKKCPLCGNDLEAQRGEAADDVRRARQSAGFYASPGSSSLTQEKDEAINRILYDSDGLSAKERLDERRKKRQSEKAGFQTGRTSLFSQERKADPAPEPLPPSAPPASAAASAEPADERPRRNFTSEFVFGEKPKPTYEPQPSAPVEAVETIVPDQQSFAVPAPVEPVVIPEAPTADIASAPQSESYFALTPSDEEQAKISVDKKNEEFQELLDREFERLKRPDPQFGQIESQLAPESPASAGTDSQAYIEDRINAYLKKSDHDITVGMRGRDEQSTPAAVEEPVREGLSYADPDRFAFPASVTPATSAFSESAASFDESPFAAVRTPAPEEGFSFDGQDFGHAFAHGEKPVSDFDLNKAAFATQETSFDPEEEMTRAGIPDQEFAAPVFPAEAEPSPGLTYADFERFDFATGMSDSTPIPAASVADIPSAMPEASAPVYTEPSAYPEPSVYPEPSAAFTEPPAFTQQPTFTQTPVYTEPPVTPIAETPVIPASAPAVAEPVVQAEEPTPWGKARNQAPTRESIAEFLDRPIEFPFDERPALEAPTADTTPAMDFEPIAPEAPDQAADPFIPVQEALDQAADPFISTQETSDQAVADSAPVVFETPTSYDQPVTPPPFDFAPVPQLSAEDIKIPEEAAKDLLEKAEATPASTSFAAPFSTDVFFGGVPAAQATEPEAIVSRPHPEETADLFAEPGLPPLTFDPPEPDKAVVESPVYAPGFVDLMTERGDDILEGFTEEPEDPPSFSDDSDGPPAFYKEYTQGFSVAQIEAANTEAARTETVQAEVPSAPIYLVPPSPAPEQPAEVFPEFLTAYDHEPLGKKAEALPPEKREKRDTQTNGKKSSARQSDARRTALSVIITILIVILVIVVACIVILKLMPDSVGAYYIQDFVEMIQSKLGIGGDNSV